METILRQRQIAVSLALPRELKKKIQARARALGISSNAYIRLSVSRQLEVESLDR